MSWLLDHKIHNIGGRKYDLFTFFCLYLAQSLPMTFFSTALQVTMRQSSFSLTAIAMLQLIKLPWVLKFLWSPMIDRHCNTMKDFRRCIFWSEGIYAAIILLVGHMNLDTSFYYILALVFISFIASATHDIATDALAVLSFDNREKGLVNSMQSLGSFSATLVGSGILLALLQRYGWHYVLPFLSVFVVFALIPLWRNRNLKLLQQPNNIPVSKADFLWFFTRKSIWRQIGFLVLYYAGIIGSLSMLRPYLVDLGYSMKEIGIMSGIVGSATACIASIISGHMIHFGGCFMPRRIVSCCSVIATAFLYCISRGTPSYVMIMTGLILTWLCYGLSTVVVYTTAMENVRPGREGTDFTVQTVITHLCGIVLSLASGKIADNLGFSSMFMFETVLAVLSAFYVFVMFKKKEK